MRYWYPILGYQGMKRVWSDTPFWYTSESMVTPKWGAGSALRPADEKTLPNFGERPLRQD